MKNSNLLAFLVLGLTVSLAGCGQSEKDRATKERARLAAEEQAQREVKASNDAVTETSKKVGRKPPTLDLGITAQKAPAPAPEKQRQP